MRRTATRRATGLMATLLAFGLASNPATGQEPANSWTDAADMPSVADAVARGVEIILDRQEGEGNAEWPYQGVYRVNGKIPIGYRVGGSAIASHALLAAPGYDEDDARQAAVARATQFIIESTDHELMQHAFESRYDVRGWGYAYGLAHLLRLKAAGRMPAELADAAEEAVQFYLDGIAATAIPERGGWNYSRRAGFQAPGRPSPFMTGPTLLALFEAVRQGYEVDADLIEAGIAALEAARTPTGAFVYAGDNGVSSRSAVPGSVGRMLVGEATLLLAGRGSVDRVRGAVDAFIVHWDWLD
ncbi:MAG: hypothetical protein HKO59_03755, partial [Phycisphaerales bacterium]|nr:hypothetical protein [Phycisphaerales bacterium]